MNDFKIRSLAEIKSRVEAIKSNLGQVKNEKGLKRLNVEVRTLENYLNCNGNVNLKNSIDTNVGEVRQTLMWIAGVMN